MIRRILAALTITTAAVAVLLTGAGPAAADRVAGPNSTRWCDSGAHPVTCVNVRVSLEQGINVPGQGAEQWRVIVDVWCDTPQNGATVACRYIDGSGEINEFWSLASPTERQLQVWDNDPGLNCTASCPAALFRFVSPWTTQRISPAPAPSGVYERGIAGGRYCPRTINFCETLSVTTGWVQHA